MGGANHASANHIGASTSTSHQTAWVHKHSSRTYKQPAFSHLPSLLPWGWLEHLVKTSAGCTLNIKLSTKNLCCFYTVTIKLIFWYALCIYHVAWKFKGRLSFQLLQMITARINLQYTCTYVDLYNASWSPRPEIMCCKIWTHKNGRLTIHKIEPRENFQESLVVWWMLK